MEGNKMSLIKEPQPMLPTTPPPVYNRVPQPRKKVPNLHSKLPSRIPRPSPQNPPQHIPPPLIRRHPAVADRKRQCPHMIRHNPVRHIDTIIVLRAHLPTIRARPGDLGNGSEDPTKRVGVVV